MTQETFDAGFARGVVKATDAALLKAPASPKAWNVALDFTGGGEPFVRTRSGCTTINTSSAGSVAFIGQYDYYRLTNTTRYHLAYTDTGVLYKNVAGTLTSLATSLGTGYPDFETAFDRCYLTSGTVQKKFDGTDVTQWGITRPTVGTLSGVAAAVPGDPTGTYELRVTFVNTSTGHESSASDTASSTVVLAGEQMDVSNIPTSSDAQVDKVYIYVRNIDTMPVFFKVGEVNEGTTSGTFTWTDAELLTIGPDTAENDPPPATIKYCCFHQGRMFVATDTALYWSKIGLPEAFDPEAYDLVNSADGQPITGLHSDREVLLILKTDRVYALYGIEPDSWEIRLLDADTGCGSHRTILSANGYVWWWSRHGLVRWNGSIDPIGMRTVGDPDPLVNYAQIARASAAYSESQHRVLVAVPAQGETTYANVLLPFNVDLGVLESDRWDPMSAASLASIVDSSGIQQIVLGSYKGQLFTTSYGTDDGIAAGAFRQGTFLARTDTMSSFSLENPGGAINTDMLERRVTVLDSQGRLITTGHRPRITFAGEQAADDDGGPWLGITISPGLTGLTVGETYTMIIGAPAVQWHSPWLDADQPWMKKRYTHLHLVFQGDLSDTGSGADVAFDFDEDFANPRTVTYAATGGWGQLWGLLHWGNAVVRQIRRAIGRVGFAARVRIRSVTPNNALKIYKLGLLSRTETMKR